MTVTKSTSKVTISYKTMRLFIRVIAIGISFVCWAFLLMTQEGFSRHIRL